MTTAPRQTPSYFPVNINVGGRRVLICGGSRLAFNETQRLLEFGAFVDVVAPNVVAELQELALTYGDRIRIFRRQFDEQDRAALSQALYLLVFTFYHKEHENELVLEACKNAGVLAFAVDHVVQSDFQVPSLIKRGTLKIAVSTDAISPPLERALVQRIEALFVSEIDKYTLFLSAMKERIERLSSDPSLSRPAIFQRVLRRLAESEELYLALQRRNFEEANHLAEAIVFEIKSECQEPAAI